MFENIIDSASVSLITFFLGLFLGHRLSLGRDRRKEFNDLSRETYRNICSQIQNRTVEIIPMDVAVLSHYFWPIKRYRFVKAAKKYKNTEYQMGEYDPTTSIYIPNEKSTDELIQNATAVSRFLIPR